MEQVYIFDFGNKLKIGYSTNVPQRLGAIESASGSKAKQIYTISGTRQIEQAAHYHLREYHIRGEYFNCKFEVAKQALNGIVSGEIVVPFPHLSPSGRKYTEAQKKSAKKWDAANLDRVSIAMPKGKKDDIKAAATAAGESMNQYIINAVDQRMEQEGRSKPPE